MAPPLEFLRDGEAPIPFPGSRFRIGSDEACELRLVGPGILPLHAAVFEDEGTWWVRDLSGSGTVRVNGRATFESQLSVPMTLQLGRVELRVRESIETEEAIAVSRSTRGRTEIPLGQTADHAPVERHRPLVPDQRIDRYRVVGQLAAGGMGEVYRAEHIELGKPVALKVMLGGLAAEGEFVARFKREAVAASQIGHPNIIDISDFGQTDDGRFYFVMELLDGKTVGRYLKDDGPFEPMRAARVMLQVGRAIAAAHAKGIIHRDLKPENVMLLQRPGQPDFVKVLDFGIAKVEPAPGEGAGLTQFGMVVGTPQYMSPEQAAGLPVDPRSDLYALGLIFYELLAGRPAFRAPTPSQLMVLQMTEDPKPLGTLDPTLPAALVTLITSLLAKSVFERTPTAVALVEALERFLAGEAPAPAAVSGPAKRVAAETKVRVSAPVQAKRAALAAPAPLEAPATARLPTPPATAPSRALPRTLVALALLLSLGGAAWLASRPAPAPQRPEPSPVKAQPLRPEPVPDAVPSPAPTPVPEQVALELESFPPGAEVFEDGVLIGTTPTTREGARDQVINLRFVLKGYQPLERRVRLENVKVSMTLEKVSRVRSKTEVPTSKRELQELPYEKVGTLKELPD